MSQEGIIDILGTFPQIPTLFIADVGFAIPILNTIEMLGEVVAQSGVPFQSVGSGNTITYQVQYSGSAVSTSATIAGVSSFNSADFTVDANGFVSLLAGGVIRSVNVDANTAPGTDPVVPNASGQITVTGGQAAAGMSVNVIRTISLTANTYTVQIQRSSAQAASTVGANGVSHFDTAGFVVDSDGFVTLNPTGLGVLSVSGTLNRITSTGGQNPVIDIAATYVGQTSITTLGTITSGTWNATTIGPTFGGTGQSTYATGDILYASAANTLSKLAASTNGFVLTLAAGVPSWAANANGDVVGPASSTDTVLARFDGTTGKLIQDSVILVGDNGDMLDNGTANGSNNFWTLYNTNDTALSGALIQAQVAGSSAGDAMFQANIASAGQYWTWGLDNSDSDAYVLSSNQLLGITNVMRVSTAGEINYPLQPAFLAYLNTGVTNVTGDGTVYTIIYDTEVYDQNGDFNLATSTFTAPVTGKYKVNLVIRMQGGTSISSSVGRIVASNLTYRMSQPIINTPPGGTVGHMGLLIDMDAADTFTVTIATTDSGGKIDDVSGLASGEPQNYLSCFLAC